MVFALKSIWREIVNVKLIKEYSKDLNVLFVEDDHALCDSTRKIFQHFFKTVDVAYDGQEALMEYMNYYEHNNYPYDIVITDINMPRMNGIELTSNILKKVPEQHIVILSAHNDVHYLLEAIDLGVSGFITKPLKNEKLMQVLYKTSMAIFDHKLVQNNVEHLEELNLKLESQNRELQEKNEQLKKSTRLLNTMSHKEEMLHPKRKKYIEEQNARDYKILQEQLHSFTKNDLFELMELINECDVIVIDIINNLGLQEITTHLELAILFKKYATTLAMYSFFNDFRMAMLSFADTIENNPLPENEETITNIFLFLETFIYDLNGWHNDLLSADDESKINAFDASNIANMRLITNMWTQSEESENSDVDTIFDF